MTAHAASLPAELSHLGNRASLSQPSTAAPAACGAGVRERQAEVVVVMLHGLMRGEASMRSLARSVHLATGLECISVGYPSSSMSLSELAAVTAQRVRDACGPDAAVFAVTHSMGGVVLRHMQGLPGTGGVRWVGCCMLAPPNRGSTVSRRLLRAPVAGAVFRALAGPAVVDLASTPEQCDARWPAPPQPCGIIAATVSLSVLNPTSWMTTAFGMLPAESDGTLALEEVKLPDELVTDFTSLDSNHSFVMCHHDAGELVSNFIKYGRFRPVYPR
eukprot:CAMPEP_0114247858 /NCGR_PEP_ID=MMETSP0058-20121206/13250_1 /TAXON_ID=36894 /ORGANISM="Pyramimonas parkeae, CCMP726" /LENGTH=273 /DNA_ID=CAMNT_0001361199 /DNA_START=343 /DNA_END=1164 /DNA_ORIENTATION=-